MNALTPLTVTVERFFRWWFSELVGLLPKGLATMPGQGRRRLVVTFADGAAVFDHGHGDNLRRLGSVSLGVGGDGVQRDLVSRMIARVRLRVREVVLRLPQSRVLRRAALEDFDPMLTIRLDIFGYPPPEMS